MSEKWYSTKARIRNLELKLDELSEEIFNANLESKITRQIVDRLLETQQDTLREVERIRQEIYSDPKID